MTRRRTARLAAVLLGPVVACLGDDRPRAVAEQPGVDPTPATAAPTSAAARVDIPEGGPTPATRWIVRPATTPRGADAPAAAETTTGPVTSDSARGVLRIVAGSPATVVLRPGRGAGLEIVGDQAEPLARLAGFEVSVRGVPVPGPGSVPDAARRMSVTSFVVRAAQGRAVVDGRLRRDGDGYILALRDGTRRPIGALPPALRGAVGARVWVTGPLDRPTDGGVIEP